MPKGYPQNECVGCERHVDECGTLSKRYLCERCARQRVTANIAQLRLHRGPYFKHWRSQMAASVGGLLLDDVQQRG